MTAHDPAETPDTGDIVPAIAIHAGDEVAFTVTFRLSGTTACSALDEASAHSFVYMTLATDDGDAGQIIIDATHPVHRQHVNARLAAA